MASLIDMFFSCRNSQEEIDSLYVNFTQLLSKEIDIYLKYTEGPRITRKHLKNSKPFWNEELYVLWKKLSESERIFSKFRAHQHVKERLRRYYINNRNIFDKVLHQTEREYN